MKEQEILDSCLDAMSAGASLFSCLEKHPELSAESLRILQTAAQLHHASAQLTPDPAFKRRSRAKLMQRMTASSQPAAAAAPAVAAGLKQRWHDFWAQWRLPILGGMQFQPLAAVLAVAVILALGGGVVAAAQKSVPGAPLYSIKRLSKQARTTLAHDDIFWQLDIAQRRLDEALVVMDDNTAKVDDLLADYTQIMSDVAEELAQQKKSGAVHESYKILTIVTDQIEQLRQFEGVSAQYEPALRSAIEITSILYPAPKSVTPTTVVWPTPTITMTPMPISSPVKHPVVSTISPATIEPTSVIPTEIISTPSVPVTVVPTPSPRITPPTNNTVKPTVPPTMAPAQQPHPTTTIVAPVPTKSAPVNPSSPSSIRPKTPSFFP